MVTREGGSCFHGDCSGRSSHKVRTTPRKEEGLHLLSAYCVPGAEVAHSYSHSSPAAHPGVIILTGEGTLREGQ